MFAADLVPRQQKLKEKLAKERRPNNFGDDILAQRRQRLNCLIEKVTFFPHDAVVSQHAKGWAPEATSY